MSYILEALKKSEQERERERGALPDIKSVHTPSSTSQASERRWWPFILLGLVVIAGATLTVVYFDKIIPPSDQVLLDHSPSSTIVEQQVAQAPAKRESEHAATKPVKKPDERETSTEKNVSPPVEQKKQNVVFSEQQLQHDDVIGNVAEQREQAAETEAQQTKSGNTERPAAVAISDIPDSVRKRIPNIAFEGHVYSSVPERRSIMINGHKRREGDTIGDDLLVREITGEGAEFEFQGYRFRLNALQDWSFK